MLVEPMFAVEEIGGVSFMGVENDRIQTFV